MLLLRLLLPPSRLRPLSKMGDYVAKINALTTMVSGGLVSTEWTEDSLFFFLCLIKSFGIF